MSIRSPILALAGVLAVVAGCAPNPPPPASLQPESAIAPGPTSGQPGHKAECFGNADEFIKQKVRHLRGPAPGQPAGFDYRKNGYADPANRRGYARPDFDQNVSQHDQAALKAAFKVLGPHYQQQLCQNVDYVFVDDNTNNFSDDGDTGMGWSFWEVTLDQLALYPGSPTYPRGTEAQADGTGRYIAVPSKFLKARPQLVNLVRTTFAKLLGDQQHPVTIPPGLVTVKGNGGPDAALAAVMLHELGHILWFQNCIADAARKCEPFRSVGWGRSDLDWPSSGIHNPKDPRGATRVDDTVPGLESVITAARQKRFEPLYQLLGVGTSSGSTGLWPSVLAAAAPDEDYADSYTFLALHALKIDVEYEQSIRGLHRAKIRNGSELDPGKISQFQATLPDQGRPDAR